MTTNTQGSDRIDCAIVGGGIHGTYLANRLLAESSLSHSNIAIFDPNARLLDSFRRKARRCGMETLRSSFVHHIGTEPFGLERFATHHDRTDELVPTVDYPPRPSLDLFLDYAEEVIAANDLDTCHRRTSVEAIHPAIADDPHLTKGDRLALETVDGRVVADTCVLAMGHGGQYTRPEWAEGLHDVVHVWGEFDPARSTDRTLIVGGGITAGQLACTLSESETVGLVSRHALDWNLSEAPPPWLNWSRIEAELHTHPPGSNARLDVARNARNDSSMPPYLYEELDSRIDDEDLVIESGNIEAAEHQDDGITLSIRHGRDLVGDRVVLATGFEPVFEHPFVDHVAGACSLARGHAGMPLLDDETLAWQQEGGQLSNLFVTGALALGTVGPYAPNIPGARRAADRIVPAIADSRDREDLAAARTPTESD